MTYTPKEVPDDSKDFRRFLSEQLREISNAFQQVNNLKLAELNVAPNKPRDGQIIYADGTNFDPGLGEGFYGRVAGAWVPMTAVPLNLSAELADTLSVGDSSGNNFTGITSKLMYYKIGKLVTGWGVVRWTGLGSAGATPLRIGGMPFVGYNNSMSLPYPVMFGYLEGMDYTAAVSQITGYVNENGSHIDLWRNTDNANSVTMPANSASAAGHISFGFSYPT